jgi:hypothetical protein
MTACDGEGEDGPLGNFVCFSFRPPSLVAYDNDMKILEKCR